MTVIMIGQCNWTAIWCPALPTPFVEDIIGWVVLKKKAERCCYNSWYNNSRSRAVREVLYSVMKYQTKQACNYDDKTIATNRLCKDYTNGRAFRPWKDVSGTESFWNTLSNNPWSLMRSYPQKLSQRPAIVLSNSSPSFSDVTTIASLCSLQ